MLLSEAEPDFEVRTGDETGQCHRLSGRLDGSAASKNGCGRDEATQSAVRLGRHGSGDDVQNELM